MEKGRKKKAQLLDSNNLSIFFPEEGLLVIKTLFSKCLNAEKKLRRILMINILTCS